MYHFKKEFQKSIFIFSGQKYVFGLHFGVKLKTMKIEKYENYEIYEKMNFSIFFKKCVFL